MNPVKLHTSIQTIHTFRYLSEFKYKNKIQHVINIHLIDMSETIILTLFKYKTIISFFFKFTCQ